MKRDRQLRTGKKAPPSAEEFWTSRLVQRPRPELGHEATYIVVGELVISLRTQSLLCRLPPGSPTAADSQHRQRTHK